MSTVTISSVRSPRLRALQLLLAGSAALALAACDKPIDFDLRGLTDGFTTAPAASEAQTVSKPVPDANGIISYPNYQVAVAQRGDTIASVAARTGIPATELARYNGITDDVSLREGEVVALPRRIDGSSATTKAGTIASGERIDITALTDEALNNAATNTGGTTQSVTTTTMTQAQASDPIGGMEPVRHQVKRGETAYSIARKYGISVRALADWNGLGANLEVQEGRYLLIPVKASEAPVQQVAETEPGAGTPTPTPPSAAEPLPDPAAAVPAPKETKPAADLGATQTSSAEMVKPVSGAIIRDYDKTKSKFILFSASSGTPVKAAKDGTVKLISTNADGVKIMVVDHGDGLQTAYSFIDGISVKKGDRVKKGQTIAKVTANEFNALQFMVFKGTQTVDPTPYLN
ncbi:LysM peptidoglycan-binding domain-containing protein [Celeribacter neptunius]|uniref:Murein DD-endopeptidase MepM and murein hydrolase activator NlpD, contain LysM domain n=1 Tax=Celeribacter neptunius TaxID=588602 RepID=A0A1I3JD58_9RHOB|nr:LysM peptidoglycan-binding domain-containing protein [Celeribacter neptunius]SFI58202.1 Murein DD-endopeptidase MepM and murein hydrolase activator NlpD, contain LysM domain [Celeribacter neptunius]